MGARSGVQVLIRRLVEEVVTVNAMAWDENDLREAVRDEYPDAIFVKVVPTSEDAK
jgi:predicted RNase H-like nuclease